jgi:hypothetical protein
VFAGAEIPGLAVGNPNNYKPFVWNSNFGLTSFSTPVNEDFNPLATRTLYVWKPDADYRSYTDRCQSTLMHYTFNPDQPPYQKPPIAEATSLLTGMAPDGAPPAPNSGKGFFYSRYRDGSEGCKDGAEFPFGQEPPWWLSIKAVRANCEATITDNPLLSPGQTVTIYSVVFPADTPPKGPPKYPQGTYLWTWYVPDPGTDGTSSRPVLFMQSQSGVGIGTSLALADYFFYENFADPIDPRNFAFPAVCPT